MIKANYLKDPDVLAFADWLANHFHNDTFAHQYQVRRTRKNWSCTSLFDAYQKYEWPFSANSSVPLDPPPKDFSANQTILANLQIELRDALCRNEDSDEATLKAAIDVMSWGGVRNGNVAWLRNHVKGLKKVICDVRNAINSGNSKPNLRDLRFNAGMTKLYSLVCDKLIIYDSRVAAALGFAVTKFCLEKSREEVPDLLAFPWSSAKETPGNPKPKRRDPSQRTRESTLEFPRLAAGDMHFAWNMKATWVLQRALDAKTPDSGQEAGPGFQSLREIEAALFMIGYDLPQLLDNSGKNIDEEDTTLSPRPIPPHFKSALTAQPTSLSSPQTENATSVSLTTPKISPPTSDAKEWFKSETASRRKKFRYRYIDDGIAIEAKSKNGKARYFSFGLDVMDKTVQFLWSSFQGKPFPLLNNVVDARKNNCRIGLGCAYFKATNGKGNPSHASFLAVLLDEVMGVITPCLVEDRGLHWTLNAPAWTDGTQRTPDVRGAYERARQMLDDN